MKYKKCWPEGDTTEKLIVSKMKRVDLLQSISNCHGNLTIKIKLLVVFFKYLEVLA